MKRDERSFIKAVERAAAADGLPKIAGGLFGLLLLQAEPIALDEIASALKVSKASVSIDARLLLSHGWLVRVTRPGDRRDFYAMAPDFFARIVEYRLERWERLRQLLIERDFSSADYPRTVRERIAYLARAQRFFARGVSRLLQDWEREMADA